LADKQNKKEEQQPQNFIGPLGPITKPIAIPIIGAIPAYYLMLFVIFVLYAISKNAFVGFAGGALMVFIVAYEFYTGVKEGGLRKELLNTALAVFAAVALWLGLGFALQTPTPINAIVSCSMLPSFERGDLVLLAGGVGHAPIYNYSKSLSDINSTAVIKFEAGAENSEAQNYSWVVMGSLLSYCATHSDIRCIEFAKNPSKFSEFHGPLEFRYAVCKKEDYSKRIAALIICVNETRFEGKIVQNGLNGEPDGSLIVYTPKPTDLFSKVGDIVHRARIGINASDGIAYITKGDNNPIYDLQVYDEKSMMGNSPVNYSQIKGNVIMRIPYLGNLKLFLSPTILADPSSLSDCSSYLAKGNR
jgi:hypothetical protein